MLQIVICDDEPDIVNLISNQLDIIMRSLAEYNCYKTTSSREVVKLAKKMNIDLLLIDIEMSEMNGFETVRQAKFKNKETIVIFITNMDLYVYESLKYHPFRFIRKTHMEEMEEAISSAVSLIKTRSTMLNIRYKDKENCEMTDIAVRIEDIIYFEAQHNDLQLVTINGVYTYRSTLKIVEKELDGRGFVRIHSGYLLNVKYIHLIRKTDVEICLSDGKKDLPVSRGRRDDLIRAYHKSLR